jgi:hypothetical protein
MKTFLLAEKDKNKQMGGFGVGAIERIKDYYEREKAKYQGILNSDKKTKDKYDQAGIKSEQETIDHLVAHAKAAIEEVKKGQE